MVNAIVLGQHKDVIKSADDPLPVLATHGGISVVNPTLMKFNRTGTLQDIEKPLDTLTTKDRYALANFVVDPAGNVLVDGKAVDPRRLVLIDGLPYLLDLRFRMLSNLELARSMGFTDSEKTYEFVGNKGQVTRQIGNAVPVHLAKALVKAILEV